MKRLFASVLVPFGTTFFLLCPALCHAQSIIPPKVDPKTEFREVFVGPRTPADFPAWLAGMQQWRRTARAALIGRGINLDAAYQMPSLRWTQRSFVQPQMMVQERFFYDPVNHRYTVDRYLHDLTQRYGGIDSVLVWPTYPNLGVDDRNQFDLTRDMPGGIAGIRRMVKAFHQHGVRVLFPLNPWDNGTRDEGVPNDVAMARLLAETGADGFNGDTMAAVPRKFFQAGENLGHPIAIEPELGLNDDLASDAWNTMSWGYWGDSQGDYQLIPGVDRYKWLETHHLVNVCNRWVHDHTDDLQYAWFNGDGFESWENVWGIWNGMSQRDAYVLRRMSAIYRAFPDAFSSAEWEPHTPVKNAGLSKNAGIYASKFPVPRRTLWTLVNRTNGDKGNVRITVPASGQRFYDLWRGVTLNPTLSDGRATIALPMEAHGYGAVLAQIGPPSAALSAMLAKMHASAGTPLASLSADWHYLPQHIARIAPTIRASSAPPGMTRIPATDHFNFVVHGVEIEQSPGVDVQYPWEDHPQNSHQHDIAIPAFYVDTRPVSNADFQSFMNAAHYHPADDHNFLRDWVQGHYPSGWADKPVTWVSQEDARAYAAWAGKRLPHEWEWQYAAQGTDGRLYPWGRAWNAQAVPPPDRSRQERPPTDGNAFPAGASPFGVLDMVGDVWQWTDEFSDTHTRAAIVRGGGYYQPQGSMWYFPEAYRLDQHGKYLLLAPSIDRSRTIGFRCVVDAAPRDVPVHRKEVYLQIQAENEAASKTPASTARKMLDQVRRMQK